LLIDAANEPERLRDLIVFEGPPVSAILTTHRHADHWQALAEIADVAGAATYAGEEDADELPVAVDERLHHGEDITVGDVTLEIIHLRGHTPGSVAVLYRDPEGVPHLFTGDSLFPGGVGKTTSPQNFTSLIDDVESRIFDVLPDETWFYPGHGDDSTLGVERPHLGEWRERGW
jgi:glyoxylase-like metal-dependent hydrolase (beta-lactamase superfamily II)